MDILVSNKGEDKGVTVFHINGRINLGNAKQLLDKAEQAIQRGTKHLLLDLSGVESITSEGLRVIHVIYKTLSKISREGNQTGPESKEDDQSAKKPSLKLVNPSPYVSKVLKTAGFELFLDIHKDLEEAIASF
jgi:anti-anti-sigma factor